MPSPPRSSATGCDHPVLDDPDLATWRQYAVRAWPTLAARRPGGLRRRAAVRRGPRPRAGRAGRRAGRSSTRRKGTLHRGDGPYVPPPPRAGLLRFPGKVVALPDGTLLVADTGHHRLVELAADGDGPVRHDRVWRARAGRRRAGGGAVQRAERAVLLPAGVAAEVGLRRASSPTPSTTRCAGCGSPTARSATVAGTGAQWMQGGPSSGPATAVALSSPVGRRLVRRRGSSWRWPASTSCGPVRPGGGDDGAVRRHDQRGAASTAPSSEAWFAQTVRAGQRADGDDAVARRRGDLGAAVGVRRRRRCDTAVGHRAVRLRPRRRPGRRGAAAAPARGARAARRVGRGRRHLQRRGAPVDPATAEVTTARDRAAPSRSDVLVVPATSAATAAGGGVGGAPAHPGPPAGRSRCRSPAATYRTRRPPTDLAAGAVELQVVFVPPPGQKLDDRYGPSTRLVVSSTPPELLESGARRGFRAAPHTSAAGPGHRRAVGRGAARVGTGGVLRRPRRAGRRRVPGLPRPPAGLGCPGPAHPGRRHAADARARRPGGRRRSVTVALLRPFRHEAAFTGTCAAQAGWRSGPRSTTTSGRWLRR